MEGLDKLNLDPSIHKVAVFLEKFLPLTYLDDLFQSDKLRIYYIVDRPYRRTECTCSYDFRGYPQFINVHISYSAYWLVKRFDSIGIYVPSTVGQKPLPKKAYFEIKLAHELLHAYEFFMGYSPNEELATLSELTFAYRHHNHYFKTQARPIKHKKGDILCRMN